MATLIEIILAIIILLTIIYTCRHYVFTLNRLFGNQRHPYIDIDTADWPSVTVFIAAHNEEAVIADSISALLQVDYPKDKIKLVPVNDRSTDGTRLIIDYWTARFPDRITPFNRTEGKPGKAAALKDATEQVQSDILIIFDADYIPAQGLIKQIVAPFFDPEVGAVMGRVVPINANKNLLTRLLDMERSGGYQVDQQARMNLGLLPQYGGTVGGVRLAALKDIGGWHDDLLAEDTDLTYRMLLKDWQTIYTNRSECYEEVPETWPVRIKQIKRWTKGHNQALVRHLVPLIRKSDKRLILKLDGVLLLGAYAMAPITALGFLLVVVLFYIKPIALLSGPIASLCIMMYGTVGNFATFFEIAAASYLDGSEKRIRLLPFNLGGFLVSLISATQATMSQMFIELFKKNATLSWDKTVRFRKHSKVEQYLPAENALQSMYKSVG